MVKLYYRQLLLDKESTAVGPLFIQQVRNYLETLGISANADNAISYLKLINESNYCGENSLSDNGYFIMYKNDNEYYWFTNPFDAIMFVNKYNGIQKDCALEGYPQKNEWTLYFDRYRGHKEKGFYWLYKDDLEFLDEIINAQKKIYCESRRLEFLSVEDAARWLTQIGKAVNINIAMKQLTKHLSGQTSSCYGMVFKEY